MANNKPHRIRARAKDGKPLDKNKVKGKHFDYADMHDVGGGLEFVLSVATEPQLGRVRAALAAAGLEELQGDTTLPTQASSNPPPARSGHTSSRAPQGATQPGSSPLQRKKPYAFAALPAKHGAQAPVWHDGSSSQGKLSGELRCELTALTPLLVGWERRPIPARRKDSDWPDTKALDPAAISLAHVTGPDDRVELSLPDGAPPIITAAGKSLLCPLRAPWGERPVLLPGESLKGLLRHELGALWGAPMERVDERSYSYRPNLSFPKGGPHVTEPRLARVLSVRSLAVAGTSVRVPHMVHLFKLATRRDQAYYPRRDNGKVIPAPPGAAHYRGGMGGGVALPKDILSEDARNGITHTHIDVSQLKDDQEAELSAQAIAQYQRTLEHLLDDKHGHFSSRHPNTGRDAERRAMAIKAIKSASTLAFEKDDIFWVDWDPAKKCIVSFGWHYYYRWSYQDTVRQRRGVDERPGLFPTEEERAKLPDDSPKKLTAVRRLFGYTGDNDGSKGIGEGHHTQLMGRIAINAAIEVMEGDNRDQNRRFLAPTFLKELGQPKPSAVEHYLRQPTPNKSRPNDQALLVTYGDAEGYDTPGELAGRKFYLDREDAYGDGPKPWEDPSEANRFNDRSTLAIEASQPARRFRFTVRFRDLEPAELAAVLLALCPDQFAANVRNSGTPNKKGYCSKLGYARPLGWGSVKIQAAELLLLEDSASAPSLVQQDVGAWFKQHQPSFDKELLGTWLGLHRQHHPDAGDYPTKDGKIYTYHTSLRADHARLRRNRGARS